MPARATADEATTGQGDFTCDCGRKFAYGGAYTKHKLKCDGQPAPTSRIAGGTGAPAKVVPIEDVAAAKRADTKPAMRRKRARIASKAKARPVSRPKARAQKRKRVARSADVISARGHRTPPEAQPALSDRAELIDAKEKLLVELRKKAQLIANAIAGLEALG